MYIYIYYIYSAEVIEINEELSLDEIKCIEDYLNDKYKIFEKAINNPGICLDANSMSDLVGWYTGDSIDLDNNVWTDISGANSKALINDNDASFVVSTGADIDEGTNQLNEFYLNGNKVLTGETTTQLIFGPPISRDFTVFNLCKYQESGSQERIIQSEEYNCIMGYHNGKSGVSLINSWITDQKNNFDKNWVLSTNQPSLYRGNGIDFSNDVTGNPIVSRLTINTGYIGEETSTFACAEIIIVNKVLSDTEMVCIENYLSDKYGLKATENPGNCLNNIESLAGWYDGGSMDVINNQWLDKSGIKFNNNGIVTDNTGIEVYDGTDTSSEFYVRDNNKVITGSTLTKIKFKPSLQPQFTIFNVAKWKEIGSKSRILQGENHDCAFGFDSVGSGYAEFQNVSITSSDDSFGSNYVISSQRANLYRGNMQDLTLDGLETNIATLPTRISINDGYIPSQTSDFGIAEIIMVNEELTNDEILCIENYLEDKYNVIKEVDENPGSCLTAEQQQNLVGWYTGDSADIDNNKLYDKSGIGNDGLIDGDFEIYDEQDPLNEFYANGNKVVTAGTSTTMIFDPLVSAEHTVFNLCKYKEIGTKGRILQGETLNSGTFLLLSTSLISFHFKMNYFWEYVIMFNIDSLWISCW